MILIIFALLLQNLTFVKVQSQRCSEVRIRRNIASYSSQEVQSLIDALQLMYENRDLENLARIHTNNFGPIHDNPQFLPWHRFFVWDFENRLRQINPSLTVPYWDTATDFNGPERSIVLSQRYFGGNGNLFNNNCIRNGFLQNKMVNYPDRHCLKRKFSGNFNRITPWHSPAFITSILQSNENYDDFRENLEHSHHNVVHWSLGGNIGDINTAHSPLDPLFFLHHSNIDRIWAKWQEGGQHRLLGMNGIQVYPNGSRSQINSDFRLAHYNVPTRDTLRITSAPLCYRYDDSSSRNLELSLAKIRLKKQLSKRTLEKYFPKLANGSTSTYHYDFVEPNDFDVKVRKPLPLPFLLPREFFEMHNFNVEKGLKVQEKIEKFIKAMNKDHYYSPYLVKKISKEQEIIFGN